MAVKGFITGSALCVRFGSFHTFIRPFSVRRDMTRGSQPWSPYFPSGFSPCFLTLSFLCGLSATSDLLPSFYPSFNNWFTIGSGKGQAHFYGLLKIFLLEWASEVVFGPCLKKKKAISPRSQKTFFHWLPWCLVCVFCDCKAQLIK